MPRRSNIIPLQPIYYKLPEHIPRAEHTDRHRVITEIISVNVAEKITFTTININ